ncbi:MAG: hypothetical protein OQK75_05815 [Gammaproteobacteria bacterium]|nr:hypothetical protein [Gammaproteobacteria bacterium]MCW8987171.1 hypothetical protein [Gammaproteobacteria bacterium]
MPFSGKIYPLSEIKHNALDIIDSINEQSIHGETDYFIPLAKLTTALAQFFDICEKIESQPELLNSDKSEFGSVSELGDYGLQLFSCLEQWVKAARLDRNGQLQISIISLAVWLHEHDGILLQLESVVNALSQIANQTSQPTALIKLHKIAEIITNSAHDMIKADIDKSEPGRAWRILNLNHGIIATRSHNIEIMNSVFEQLIHRLPNDAPTFFAEGMKQMDIINYPEHVKHAIEHFYQLTNKPTLH